MLCIFAVKTKQTNLDSLDIYIGCCNSAFLLGDNLRPIGILQRKKRAG